MNLGEGRTMKRWAALAIALALSAWSPRASAQSNDQQGGWGVATTITAIGAGATALIMPRVFYGQAETTVGWKARYHVLQLAPALVLTGLTVLNEYALKQAIGAERPGCSPPPNGGDPVCPSGAGPYETLSSHSFAAFSAFGQGTAVFVVDTIKWNGGRLNAGAIAGDIVVPLILAGVTAVGRVVGNWEDSGSVILSSGVGIVMGAITGVLYATLVGPECGYTGNLICW